jgi:hypothetical protein
MRCAVRRSGRVGQRSWAEGYYRLAGYRVRAVCFFSSHCLAISSIAGDGLSAPLASLSIYGV